MILRNYYNCFLMIVIFCAAIDVYAANTDIDISVKSKTHQKMKLILGLIGQDDNLITLGGHIKNLLERKHSALSGFDSMIQIFEEPPSKTHIKALFEQGYPLALFLSTTKEGTIEWRMYEARDASMIKGKRFENNELTLSLSAEHIANEIWLLLTGQEGFFSSRIAFCKEIVAKGKRKKQLYITVPYAHHENVRDHEVLMVDNAQIFAPRWNNDAANPLLLYSESTPSNVRLMATTMQRRKRIISNLEGVNMLPSYNTSGREVVCCFSVSGISQLYRLGFDPMLKKDYIKQLTFNTGNNISPTLCDNGDIIFCSDYQGHGPQIYYYHADTQDIDPLTHGGYCTTPSYNKKNNYLAYSKLCDGVMQIFICNLAKKEHQQITFDKGDKEECTWSPCGNYLAFSVDTGKTSRIAIHSMLTTERLYITAEHDKCSYPAWSPYSTGSIVIG